MVKLLKIIMGHEKLVNRNSNRISKYLSFVFLAGIVSTMKSKAGPAYRVLNTLAEYEKFLEHNDHGIIGYFESETSALKNDLVKVAGQLSEKFRFAYTTAKEILDKVGQTKYLRN